MTTIEIEHIPASKAKVFTEYTTDENPVPVAKEDTKVITSVPIGTEVGRVDEPKEDIGGPRGWTLETLPDGTKLYKNPNA